jgi:mannan endo-1,4-beta-mannosidase
MISLVRRVALPAMAALVALTSACTTASHFVKVENRRFTLDGRPMYVCGTNLWYGAHLGRPSNPVGRARLLRELDRLQQLGVNNLRVLGSAEDCAVPKTLKPAIQTAPGVLNEDVLLGLDFLIQQADHRGMKLVVFLNNYWDWSGGIPQYLAWATGHPAVGLGQIDWKAWNRLQSQFYTNEKAMQLYRDYLALILNRTNTLTGRKYRDEPAIMAWQLANEPRPGEREEDNDVVFAAFLKWVDSTSAYIHTLDTKHLVTTGSEGFMGGLYSDDKFQTVHAVKGIDYATYHLWPKNWRWFDLARWAETTDTTVKNARDYAARHIARADAISKPVVLEEFGLDRDGGLTVDVPTTSRDRLFAAMFGLIEASAATGGSAAGSNFWLWGGEGRPPQFTDAPDGIGAGDMLQEEPGRNTVFDCDASTLRIIGDHFAT